MSKKTSAAPKRVAILGLGPSLNAFIDVTKSLGAVSELVDEVWGINAIGDVVQCDRIFHMDDVRIQEIRAAAKPDSNIAAMLGWLKKHPGPIYTSRPSAKYPGTVAYPLQDVMRSCGGKAYFNSTAAYAVAYAVSIGVEHLFLFGFDFTYPNSHQAEKGRACVEFYLGLGVARGMRLGLPNTTTLLDGLETARDRMYGYDTVDLAFDADPDGQRTVTMKPISRRRYQTAAEIEARYDHSKHPNAIVALQAGD